MLQHETVTLNGTPIHYVRDGAGPTILFLHGFPEFWYAWQEQLAAFAGDHQVVAPDLRGYNLSGKPAEVAAYAIPELVADVRGLLDQVSPGRPAVLVGHDWGAVTAWAFAMRHPDYLSHLVIINAPHPAILAREMATNPAQQAAMGYMARLLQPGAAEGLRAGDFAFLSNVVFGGAARPEAFSAADQAAYRTAWGQPGALEAMLNYYRANPLGTPPAGAPPTVPLIQVPTLVLWGDKDAVFLPGTLNGLDALVPGVQVQHIANGTHWVVHEEGATITAAIRAFITP
ncbi:MAG: alpha/beta hydrolase [Chloroflexota bacterium]|nr:alpha/beta hydrolase [Chloroflexota bacterium]